MWATSGWPQAGGGRGGRRSTMEVVQELCARALSVSSVSQRVSSRSIASSTSSSRPSLMHRRRVSGRAGGGRGPGSGGAGPTGPVSTWPCWARRPPGVRRARCLVEGGERRRAHEAVRAGEGVLPARRAGRGDRVAYPAGGQRIRRRARPRPPPPWSARRASTLGAQGECRANARAGSRSAAPASVSQSDVRRRSSSSAWAPHSGLGTGGPAPCRRGRPPGSTHTAGASPSSWTATPCWSTTIWVTSRSRRGTRPVVSTTSSVRSCR